MTTLHDFNYSMSIKRPLTSLDFCLEMHLTILLYFRFFILIQRSPLSPPHFSGTIDEGLSKLEKVEEELRRSQLDATDLAQTPAWFLK